VIDALWYWQLVDPQPFEEPIPATGRLGLWIFTEGSTGDAHRHGDRKP
jgi:hypothetical protein